MSSTFWSRSFGQIPDVFTGAPIGDAVGEISPTGVAAPTIESEMGRVADGIQQAYALIALRRMLIMGTLLFLVGLGLYKTVAKGLGLALLVSGLVLIASGMAQYVGAAV